MSDTPTPAKPNPEAEKAGVEPSESQPLQSGPVGAEPLATQPLQLEEIAAEPLQNMSVAEPPESEQPAVKQPQKRLEKLLEERQKLDERIKKVLEKEANEKRQRETRQKILIGAVIQKQITKGTLTQDWLLEVLDAELTLERDRKLFHLPPLPETMAPTKGAG